MNRLFEWAWATSIVKAKHCMPYEMQRIESAARGFGIESHDTYDNYDQSTVTHWRSNPSSNVTQFAYDSWPYRFAD